MAREDGAVVTAVAAAPVLEAGEAQLPVAVAIVEESTPPPSVTAHRTGFNAAHQTGPAAASRGAPQKKRVTVRGSVRALRPTVSVHRGCPTVTCWGASVRDKCEKVGILLGGLLAYTFVAAVIIFGALGISKALAATEVEGGWLTFVSILLCVLLFGLCGASWTYAADENGHKDATAICLGGWGISCLCACVLGAVIVHPLDELHLVESAGEPVFGVPALLNSSHDATLRQQIESAGEIEFAPGAFLDLSLAWPVVEDKSRSCGEDCSYSATVVEMCMAPVLKACGSGALVSSTKCAEVSNICTARGQAPPTCRPSVSSGFVPASYPNYREKDCEGNNKCGRCEGDCDNDDECATGLRCFQRDTPTQQIPGCTGYNPDDADDDFCYDPTVKHPQIARYDVDFFLYIEPQDELDSKDDEIDDQFADYSSFCDRLFTKYMKEGWDDSDTKPGALERYVTSGRSSSGMPGQTGGPVLAGRLAQYFRQNQDAVMWAYEHGPLVDAKLQQPQFFKWQPEIGYERHRLRKKVMWWCVAVGFGWLPIVAAVVGCAWCINS
jgi:hypothetical protein